jgi:hypothetical protein
MAADHAMPLEAQLHKEADRRFFVGWEWFAGSVASAPIQSLGFRIAHAHFEQGCMCTEPPSLSVSIPQQSSANAPPSCSLVHDHPFHLDRAVATLEDNAEPDSGSRKAGDESLSARIREVFRRDWTSIRARIKPDGNGIRLSQQRRDFGLQGAFHLDQHWFHHRPTASADLIRSSGWIE